MDHSRKERGVTLRYKVRFGKPQRKPEPPEKADDATKPPATRLARQLTLAHHVERLVEGGVLRNHAAAARALGVSRARIAQVMVLLHLSPDIQAAVLAGRVRSERQVRAMARETSWVGQSKLFEQP